MLLSWAPLIEWPNGALLVVSILRVTVTYSQNMELPQKTQKTQEKCPASVMHVPNPVRLLFLSAGNARALGLSWGFGLAVVLLFLAFSVPLVDLMQFAVGSDLYSHIVLIPFISLYLVWLRRAHLAALIPSRSAVEIAPRAPTCSRRIARYLAGGFSLLGALALIPSAFAAINGTVLGDLDQLAGTTLAFLLLFFVVCSLFITHAALASCLFPLAFLLFAVPFPHFVQSWVETLLLHGSTAVAMVCFQFYDTPVLSHQLVFQLPGFVLEVAPQCSGIHSTLVLLITSLLAGHLFLRNNGKRAALALAVLPVALVRNGVRVFVIGQMCVDGGPAMIHSSIHRNGGPLFFALSLAPLFLLLFVLWKSEQRKVNH